MHVLLYFYKLILMKIHNTYHINILTQLSFIFNIIYLIKL